MAAELTKKEIQVSHDDPELLINPVPETLNCAVALKLSLVLSSAGLQGER